MICRLLGLTAATSLIFGQTLAAPQLIDAASIPAVIAAMTLEEKAALVSGTGMNNAEKVAGAAGSSFAIPRLGIPQMVFADGPVGVRLGAGPTGGEKRFATAFPVSSAMAATWDPALIEQVGRAIGSESRSYGIDMLLGPAINIQRDPLNGRNFEYFSEDPYLTGRIASAYIQGVQSQGVGAVVKHFAANNQETRRQSINQLISERALYEIYFPGFEATMAQGQPWGVMSSYPMINGVPASQNAWLLKQVLRDQWQFTGFVMSDWFGVSDPVGALTGGNDLNMPGGAFSRDTPFIRRDTEPKAVILAALQEGKLTEQQLDENIAHILRVLLKTPVFKDADTGKGKPLADHAAIARAAAIGSIVLLKNEQQTLPLQEKQRIAAFGRNVQHFYLGGGGSAEVNADPQRVVDLKTGLQQAGYPLLEAIGTQPLDETATPAQIAQALQQSDLALISIGRSSSEGADRYSMALHPDELAMIRQVSEEAHRQQQRVVVLLNIGAPVDIQPWEHYADAIVLVWQPGQEGGHAIAEILSGKSSPSGRLPLTFPKHYRDTPSFGNFPGTETTVHYGEGLYVGYRHYDTRQIEPMYPFGYGLSYARFDYGSITPENLVLDRDQQQSIEVGIRISNLSSIRAQEVVQLYIHDHSSRLDRPEQELKGFQKIDLAPQQSKEVVFTVNQRDLSYYDPDKQGWILDPGRFTLRIGSSSRDIRAQAPLRVTSATPAITLETPWISLQTYQDAATIVAGHIGDDEVNAWIRGKPTLGEKLQAAFSKDPAMAEDTEQQRRVEQAILQQLNAL